MAQAQVRIDPVTRQTRAMADETLAAGGRETLSRSDHDLVDATLSSDTFHALPPLRGANAELVQLGPVLGAGAMGVVRDADQPSLRRRVAVKELRDGAPPDLVAALVREAWVAGRLDHPNVVPVHALCQGERSPLLVMKRIDGTPWAEVLSDETVARRFGVEDRLEWHLDVLSQLCRAVHFAHSRGILHLDLKPENVMLGEFGEVYLLDWGVAASFRADGPAWLPHTSSISRVCGTPAFMAPEMAAGDGARFGPRTDVYQLGAILHEIVTGRPRHGGTTVRECLLQAWASEPVDFPPDVPSGLAAIVNRATARAVDERYPDVEAFRRAVHDFLAHRSSAQLVDAALARLEDVRRAATADAVTVDDVELQRRAIECRFALEQARKTWPDNPAVPEALQSLIAIQIERAIANRRADIAAALLADLPRPAPALAARVEALRTDLGRERSERAALEKLRHDVDLNVHRGRRTAFVVALSALWAAWSLVSGHLTREGILAVSWETNARVATGVGVLLALGAWFSRKTLLRTQVNRKVFEHLAILFVSATALLVLGWRLDIDPGKTRTLAFALITFFVLANGVSLDRKLLLPGIAIVLVVGTPTVLWPAYALEFQGLFGVLLGLTALWYWRRPARQGPTASPP